ncbi:MAG: type II toxin-antitoxin system HicB family antitoxin [Microcoleus sp. PH2017_15_JOR_U_A]|uniref:type II toxin-antitoxin system HicB family antitoxin n=1 Tax=unclassified Microcoleus TaxID=2642155 RepID=UPI001D3B0504|nr:MULTISPECIES: type II toxin-antitoxin system HicB family antitoxin [unclassified Microcoleus]TAE70029.1 MAG: type II toxin-antitoxin system HicB family antitoxin [Oscillatoriales cyanobacterium]MCC3473499.1 type II toxin-antitoxin system HicB family antitoxin [Microcoleus sp. PH2017_13_LAR_U_A]MCC3485888.1 type II toxin-antitoxin system HicB family antitoxin [Microcoleus sp. PH2017_14_LAR_D_A]MCC3497532.1 type II toxin-antitoxin system HicB family antitoxin [Microcoleus sp. PH2017_15_JOR_U_A
MSHFLPTPNLHEDSHYTIIIQWSDEDNCYVVSFPEWGDYCHTHGDTYEDALKNAREVLELLTESTVADGKPLPQPQLFGQFLQHA